MRRQVKDLVVPRVDEMIGDWKWPHERLAAVSLLGKMAMTGDLPNFITRIKRLSKDDGDSNVRAMAVDVLRECLEKGQFCLCHSLRFLSS